ncbi:MAG: nucleoside/nucleotide kinase family protein [Rhodobacteraceae bacterium]|nr:nucleoside/nucleotide kinase family protein [Paracoccaceae bacterium]
MTGVREIVARRLGMFRDNSPEIEKLIEAMHQCAEHRRCMIAVAGPPASGKSTFADQLALHLNERQPNDAAVLPMDGFHFDNQVLVSKGWLHRKGAPHTFDIAGLSHILSRLRHNNDTAVAVPVFDRDLEISRAGARLIDTNVRHVIVEGNYLLLGQPPWDKLKRSFDLTVYLDVPAEIIEKRLAERWRHLSSLEATRKIEYNDLPNAELVHRESQPADITIDWSPETGF